MPVRFRVKPGINQVLGMLDRLVSDSAIRAGEKAGADEFTRLLGIYPAERHAPQPFVSEKQRRGFFYYLRMGVIKVPYPRTERLKNAWVTKSKGDHFVAQNSHPQGSLVQGAKRTRYHTLTGWKTPAEIWREYGDSIRKMIRLETIKHWYRGG